MQLITSVRHFADGILKYISFKEMFVFWFEFDWNLFPKVMAWCQTGDMPLPEQMLTNRKRQDNVCGKGKYNSTWQK